MRICELGNDSYNILHITLESLHLRFSFRSDMLEKVTIFFRDVLTAGGGGGAVCVYISER